MTSTPSILIGNFQEERVEWLQRAFDPLHTAYQELYPPLLELDAKVTACRKQLDRYNEELYRPLSERANLVELKERAVSSLRTIETSVLQAQNQLLLYKNGVEHFQQQTDQFLRDATLPAVPAEQSPTSFEKVLQMKCTSFSFQELRGIARLREGLIVQLYEAVQSNLRLLKEHPLQRLHTRIAEFEEGIANPSRASQILHRAVRHATSAATTVFSYFKSEEPDYKLSPPPSEKKQD